MKTRWDIILAGSGGQGLGVAGNILGRAAIIYKNYNAVHNQSYGAMARGGLSQSTIIISKEEIIYPFVEEADFLLALTSEAYKKYEPMVKDSGIILYDSDTAVEPMGRVKEYSFPFAKEAKKLGHPLGITILALGTALKITEIMPSDPFIKALNEFFKSPYLELNIKSFKRGMELV
ncbi:MAG TPA: 2-oxoacid:ferredoxin oxidoreductase subunit gamma [Peptococcaceae bacterium]|nr:MAG: Pyruvate:ferredoxin oxidoreductase, gamma subunit [Clostridia bacterium 41_269]HBT20283.1 2-oxoacid:ferredoxin oxidoreductase subunit gamma [Peptococcaceae bacterium]